MNISKLIADAENELQPAYEQIEKNEEIRTKQILKAFQKERVSYRHFAPSSGYGYDDIGRDTLERIYASVFHTEAALMRPHIASGTAALGLTLFGMTKPGDRIISATGLPYDTLHGVIGIGNRKIKGSLSDMGVMFDSIELKEGRIDTAAVERSITSNTTLIITQRSRGYAWRPSLFPQDFAELSEMIRSKYPEIRLMVDNCYGEFVCKDEPTDYGADLCVGSLIKNPGGGIAPTGGYVTGRKDDIERIAGRLTAPGLGREIGSYEASYRPYYQGLFMAPHTVAQALKTALLASRIFENLGLKTSPSSTEKRADIIQAIQMQDPQRLVAFCQGIQAVSPVDSYAMPEPWNMPGYDDQVVMAAGTFVAGASIELSADGPMRHPYTAFMQGGLTYVHGRIAMSEALSRMMENGSLPSA